MRAQLVDVNGGGQARSAASAGVERCFGKRDDLLQHNRHTKIQHGAKLSTPLVAEAAFKLQ